MQSDQDVCPYSTDPDPCFSGRPGFRNLDPSDGGWFLNPMLTVFIKIATISTLAVAKSRLAMKPTDAVAGEADREL